MVYIFVEVNLDVIMGFDEQQLLVQLSHRNLINRKGFILCHHSPVNANVLLSLFLMLSTAKCSLISAHHIAPARHVRPRHAHAHAPSVRPAAPRHAMPRPRPGSARRANARVFGSPTSSYRLHKWCTHGPPFKSVEILFNYQYGIKQLIS